jgi:hypothetical protein
MTKKLYVVKNGVKIPVEKVLCAKDGTLQGIYCADGSSYDGFNFTYGHTDLMLVVE